MPFVIIWAVLIIAAPLGALRYIRYRRNRKYKNEISLNVKNRLISAENYGEFSGDVLRMVKSTLLRNGVIVSLLITGFFAAVIALELLGRFGSDAIICTIGAYIVILLIFAVPCILEVSRLSIPQRLIKIKGFVFRKSPQEFSVIYYDMPKTEYRIFTQSTLLNEEKLAVPGSFVNLIGIRKKGKVRIIRILSF